MGCGSSRKTEGDESAKMQSITSALRDEIDENKEHLVENAKETKNSRGDIIKKQITKEKSTLADKVNKCKRDVQKPTNEATQNVETKRDEIREGTEMNDSPNKDESSRNIEQDDCNVDVTHSSNKVDTVHQQY